MCGFWIFTGLITIGWATALAILALRIPREDIRPTVIAVAQAIGKTPSSPPPSRG